jgi:hypothetical protein
VRCLLVVLAAVGAAGLPAGANEDISVEDMIAIAAYTASREP